MYESFYKFKAEPFRLSPDHRFCFSHKSYAKAKAYMQYAIHRAEGFVMVTGKPGTGKTTLVNDLVEGLSAAQIVVATIVSTQLEADDLLRLVACNFGLDIDAPNKAVVLQGLSVRLRRHHEEGTRALLIIDEAQDLSASALEELRLLTNLQLNNQPLLQIFLIGQENLRDLVQRPSMEQVHQRLVAACHLESLNEDDTKAYIKHRLDRVGWKDDPTLDEGVFSVAYQFSQGIPRRINLVCSRFLLHGSVEEKHRIRASDVRTVVQELQNEQLTPIGFKAELPPLDDDEELEEALVVSENEAQEIQEAPQASVPESIAVTEAEADTGNADSEKLYEPISDQAPQAATLKELNNSLEMLIQESDDDASAAQKNTKAKVEANELTEPDVIQEDYFSLGDVIDTISEPVPIGEARKNKKDSKYGYGDRFASAQRKSQQKDTNTHFYNEYQTGGGRAVASHKKRGIFSTILLFMVILVILFAGIYIVRPQILQSEISYAEGKFSQYVDFLRATYTNHDSAPAVLDERIIEEKEKALNAIHAEPKDNPPLQSSVTIESKGLEMEIELPVSHSDHTEAEVAIVTMPNRDPEDAMDTTVLSTKDNMASPSDVPGVAEEKTINLPESIELAAVDDHQSDTVSGSKDSVDQPDLAVDVLSTFTDESRVFSVSSARINHSQVYPDAFKSEENSLFYKLSKKRSVEKLHNIEGEKRTQVLFETDSTSVDTKFYPELDNVIMRLTKSDSFIAKITGYTDSMGDPDYNQKLSILRATAVADYLEDNNINSDRLVIEGRGILYAGSENVPENVDASKRSQRMVEIVLVSPVPDR